jgi:hypothetical protein
LLGEHLTETKEMMLPPRVAALAGYIAVAIVLCFSDATHLPQTAYVIAYALGFAIARFGPNALEHLRGRAYANPLLAFGVIVGATIAAQVGSLVLAALNVSANDITTIHRITVAVVYSYLWEILYDLGGPKKRLSFRAASDAVARLVARVAALHAPLPAPTPSR